ncbi:MAG: hypothetical protein ACSHXL_02100 [Bacteroidota bacterium]
MKKILLITSLLLANYMFSQKRFEWGSAPQGVSMEYISLNAFPGGGVFAISDNSRLNEMRGDWKFVDGKGKEFTRSALTMNDGEYKLLRFAEDGSLLWFQSWQGEYLQIQASTVGPDGKIYLAVYIDYYDENEDGEYGVIPYPNGNGYKEVTPGNAIIQLSKNGDIERIISVPDLNEEAELEIMDFQIYNGNQFLMVGVSEDGKLTKSLDLEDVGGGGDFIILLDHDGKTVWADLVAHRKNSCCTGTTEGTHVSVAPDGTIYLGAAYFNGGIFTNGLQTLAPAEYSANSHSNSSEAYVVSYSPKGEINWIKTAGSRSRLHGLVATNKGVYVAHRDWGNRSFGENIDTTGNDNFVITYLDEKGKSNWNFVTEIERIGGMVIDENQNLIATGDYKNQGLNYNQKGKIGDLEMGEREKTFVVKISPKGKVLKLWSVKLSTNRNVIPLLVYTDKKSVFLTTETQMGANLKINLYYPELPSVTANWGCALLAKIVF